MWGLGAQVEEETLGWIRERAAVPGMSRYRLAREVCERLQWCDARGKRREMACRQSLLKLARRGVLPLPAARREPPQRAKAAPVEAACFVGTLAELGPIALQCVTGDRALGRLWDGLMAAHHPLGPGPLCGAQLRYLIVSERYGLLGALAFSAAARRLRAREAYLGWSEAERQRDLQHVVCNSRLLIAPSVQVKYLASQVLGRAARTIGRDWQAHYGYAPWALETFVAAPWRGSAYRGANWVEVGETAGRGREDRARESACGRKRVFIQILEPARFPNAGRTQQPTRDWAQQEFGAADLDARLVRRTIGVARDFFAHPTANLPQACGSAARLKGALRLFQHKHTTMETLLAPHREATWERIGKEPIVLAVCDSTTVNYSAHPATEDLGPIGSTQDGPVGLWLHETLAFTPAGVPLGLLQVQHWARDPERFGAKHARKVRPFEEKESYKWMKSWQAVVQAQAACEATQIVMVADRESDVYELIAAAHGERARLLIRAEANRRLQEGEAALLWPHLHAQPVAGTVTLKVGKRQHCPAREATVSVRFSKVTLRPPAQRSQLGTLSAYAVWAREETPPEGVEPLDWMLITTVPTTSFEQACERLSWYACRWGIEIYHRTLKNGCRIEQRQLGEAKRLEACLAIDLVVAWRVFHLVHLGRSIPQAPCTLYFEEMQWKALLCFTDKSPIAPAQPPSLNEAMRRVAKLGGFLGRKGDGDPGAQTLWLGLQRLDDITAMYRLFAIPPAQAP